MIQLIEGTHYRRRENQPSHAPHKSKEAVDCLLCIDPGDVDDVHGDQTRRKRSRPIGINIRLDRFAAHIKSHHPDACGNGARSLLQMGFTRRNVRAEATAPDGDEHERMASVSLINASSVTGQDPQSQRIRQPSLPQATAATPSTAIAERITVTGSMNFRAFAEQVDAVIKANSAAQVIPSAEAIAAEVLKQQKDYGTQQHGTGVFREI